MSEVEGRGQAAEMVEIDVDDAEEALFDAPTKGSADELLDAGAHSDLDAMRH